MTSLLMLSRTCLHSLHESGHDASRNEHTATRQAAQRHCTSLSTNDGQEHVHSLQQ
jgi:hypothetical protein